MQTSCLFFFLLFSPFPGTLVALQEMASKKVKKCGEVQKVCVAGKLCDSVSGGDEGRRAV